MSAVYPVTEPPFCKRGMLPWFYSPTTGELRVVQPPCQWDQCPHSGDTYLTYRLVPYIKPQVVHPTSEIDDLLKEIDLERLQWMKTVPPPPQQPLPQHPYLRAVLNADANGGMR